MPNRPGVQVDKDHYQTQNYDNLPRFITYYYQIDLIRQLNPDSILEIGIGNRTVSNYLKNNGYNVTSCDFDVNLAPDCTADIRAIPFKDETFDAILACEILEHIPWDDIEQTMAELSRVTRKYLVISVPYCSKSLELIIKPPFIHRIRKKPVFIDILFKVPCFLTGRDFSSQHYWEIGRRGYDIRKIRNTFLLNYNILKESRPILQTYLQFFVLEKKTNHI